MFAAFTSDAIGLNADHVDGGGHRYRDGPGLLSQVTILGDVVSRHAPLLIISEVKNFLPRLVLIRAKVGAIALHGRSTFVSETKCTWRS